MAMASRTTFPCDQCDPNLNSLAYRKCLDCDKNLCQICFRTHESLEASRHHTTRDLGTLDTESRGKIQQRTLCDKHPEQEISRFCQHCNVLVCVSCIGHEIHPSKTVADAAADLKRSLEVELCHCDDTLQHLSIAEKQHEELNKIINDAERREIEAIEKRYSILHQALENEVIRKKSEIQAVYSEHRKKVEPAAALIQKKSKDYVSAKEDLQKLIREGTNIEILKNGPALKQHKEALTVPQATTNLTNIFKPAEVEPRGIMSFLLGNIPKERKRLNLVELPKLLPHLPPPPNLPPFLLDNPHLLANPLSLSNPIPKPIPKPIPLSPPYECGKCGNKKEAALVCVPCKSTTVELLKDWAS